MPDRLPYRANMSEAPRAPLSLATLFAYSLPAVAVNFSFVLFVSFYSKYAVDVLLVAPAAIGLIFGAGRLFDAVLDPFLGVLSDRTQHAWGRRRPWMAASMVSTGPSAMAAQEPNVSHNWAIADHSCSEVVRCESMVEMSSVMASRRGFQTR